MRRDMDLVREMLIGAANADGSLDATCFVDDSHNIDCIVEHVRLLMEAGLVEGEATVRIGGKRVAMIQRLTWAGNDFLDAVQNDRIWKKIRVKIAQISGAATFDVVKALAVQELTKQLLQP